MKKKYLIIGSVALAIVVGGGYYLYSQKQNSASKTTLELPRETFTSEMHGLHDAEVLTEKDFIKGMIPHHQEAVDTAKEIITRSENPQTRELAKKIVTTQEKEIADMKRWHQSWYNEAYKDDGAYQPMMPKLDDLTGKELDKAFLEGMIQHHMGALMMAQQVSMGTIEHTEIKTFTQTIAEAQSSEIIEMRILLKQY